MTDHIKEIILEKLKIGNQPSNLIQMKNGKEYIIKFSKQAEKDKTKLKSSG